MNYDEFYKALWWQERSAYLSYLGTKLVPGLGIEPKRIQLTQSPGLEGVTQ